MIPEVPKEDVDVDIEGTLYDFDLWVFERIAHLMLSGISPTEARQLWQPVLDLPVPAHDWVRAFLEEWFRAGLPGTAKNFEAIWSEMIKHMLDSPVWSPEWKHGWFHVHDVVAELMGIRSARASLGQAKHTRLVEGMAPLYERWTERWIKQPDLAISFAYFLSTESGSLLLPEGIRRIAAVLSSFSDYDWRRERLTDALSAAVRTCWKKYREQLRSAPEFWRAFLTVLNALCARQDAISLAIQSEATRNSAETGGKN